MIKIAICDDEENFVDKIKNVIFEYEKKRDIQFTTGAFLSGVSLIRNFDNYNLIFLDIDMPELNGLEVARKLREANVISKIIYVTNHAHLTSQALSVHAFGYIVKPFEDSEVFSLLEDFTKFLSVETQTKCKRLSFKTSHGIICLNTDDILYFEYNRNDGVKIVTKDKIVFTRSTLQEIQKMVEHYGFASPHKSFAVNLLYVKGYDGLNILMENNDNIAIAQKRASSFKTEHNKFMRSV